MKHISESIIGRKGNTGKGLKGMLREFDIVTCRNPQMGGPYLVIFDKDIIDKFIHKRCTEAYPGLLLRTTSVFMFLGDYTDDLMLSDSPAWNRSDYDIVEVYRNPFLDSEIFKRDIMAGKHDRDLDANSILQLFRGRNIYEKIWERK